MSPYESILGLSGLWIQRVERHKDIHVWARPSTRPACIYCQHKGVRIKATHRRTLKHTRQGNQIMVVHLRVPKYHCPQCNRYFRHRFSGILPRLRATEAYRLEVFEAHEGGVTQRKLARTHRIGTATVERWYQSFVRQRVRELSGRPCPQVLGIDEHFLKLWQQYDPEGRRNRGLLSLMRRHHWKLSAVQTARLHQYLAHDPVLHALYFAKQQLNGFLVMKTLNQQRVREILPKFLRLLGQFECNQPSVMNALSPDNGVEPTIHATKKKSPPGRVAIRR